MNIRHRIIETGVFSVILGDTHTQTYSERVNAQIRVLPTGVEPMTLRLLIRIIYILYIFIIWLAPRAGKMSQILDYDWLPERARWSYLARSGLPVARPLGIESLIPTTMQSFLRFSRCFWGKRSLKSSVNFLNIYLKERKENGIVLV